MLGQLVAEGEHMGKGRIWARVREKHGLGGSLCALTFTLVYISFRASLDCLIHTDVL